MPTSALVHAIEDGTILNAIKEWKTNRSNEVIATKALDLVEALLGFRGTNATMKLRDQYFKEQKAAGNVVGEIALGIGKRTKKRRGKK